MFTVKEKENVACPVLCVVTGNTQKEYHGVTSCNVKQIGDLLETASKSKLCMGDNILPYCIHVFQNIASLYLLNAKLYSECYQCEGQIPVLCKM